jgi:predicted transcriptional regulator
MALLFVHGAPSAEEGAIVGKRGKASMAIAIELSDHQAQALSEAAARLQVSESELAAAAVRDLLANQSADFDAAAQRVLEKNQELYRRLA